MILLLSAEHKDGTLAGLLQLLKDEEWPLLGAEAPLLIAVANEEGILPRVGRDPILFQRRRQHFVTRVLETDAEGLVEIDRRRTSR